MNKKEIKDLLAKLIWVYPLIALLLIFGTGIFASHEDRNIQSTTFTSEQESLNTFKDDKELIEEGTVESQNNDETSAEPTHSQYDTVDPTADDVHENGNYTSKEEVALYIHIFKKLPNNYISKNEAKDQGWNPESGNLSDVLPGMSIGGSSFGNFEEKLPKAEGRKYFECDIDYIGPYRNSKRLIYSNDGLIYYTEDHYNTFERLY